MKVSGKDAVLFKLSVAEKKMNAKIARALSKAGGKIIDVAIPKTPLKTGELRRRSFNEGPLKIKDTYSQVVGYEKYGDKWETEGGDAYAVVVHEVIAPHRVGEDHYLEKAMKETAPQLLKDLQTEIKL